MFVLDFKISKKFNLFYYTASNFIKITVQLHMATLILPWSLITTKVV